MKYKAYDALATFVRTGKRGRDADLIAEAKAALAEIKRLRAEVKRLGALVDSKLGVIDTLQKALDERSRPPEAEPPAATPPPEGV